MPATANSSSSSSPWTDATLASVSASNVLSTTIARFQFSNMPIALCSARDSANEAKILWVNAAFVRLAGISAKEAIGNSALLIAGSHPDAIHLAEVELLREHPEQMPFGIVVTKQRPDGSWYDVEEHIVSLGGGGGGRSRAGRKPTHYLIAQIEIRPAVGASHRAQRKVA